jgi:hypothetical protein
MILTNRENLHSSDFCCVKISSNKMVYQGLQYLMNWKIASTPGR